MAHAGNCSLGQGGRKKGMRCVAGQKNRGVKEGTRSMGGKLISGIH